MIVLSGINFGTKGELQGVSLGPVSGEQVSLPIYEAPGLIPMDVNQGGCAVLVPSFSLVCKTIPGIAGPHTWLVTTRGQVSEATVVGETRYSPPRIEAIDPHAVATEGNVTVVMSGAEFGVSDPDATFKVVFSKASGGGLDACDAFGIDTSQACFEIPGTRAIPTLLGNERLSFTVPAYYGNDWSVRLVVSHMKNGQHTQADAPLGVSLSYADPIISGVVVEPWEDHYRLTITGANFCDRNLHSRCGELMLCPSPPMSSGGNTVVSGDASSTVPATNATYCETNLELAVSVADIDVWIHTRIVAYVREPSGVAFVSTGGDIDGTISSRQRTEFRSFDTEAMTIVSGGDFVEDPLTGDIVRNEAIPTDGGGLSLRVWVDNLKSVEDIKVSVNRVTVAASSVHVKNATRRLFEILFIVPPGSGTRQSILVLKNNNPTQNSAFVWFAPPSIDTVVLVSDTATSVTSKPGVIPTKGVSVRITGRNFGDTSANMNGIHLEFASPERYAVIWDFPASGTSTGSNFGSCTMHTHKVMECDLPPGQGTDFKLTLVVAGQNVVGAAEDGSWPLPPKSIDYTPPSITSFTPKTGGTGAPPTMRIVGSNFGVARPDVSVFRDCAIVRQSGGYHDGFACKMADGEGENFSVVVTVGGQAVASTARYSFEPPQITAIHPLHGRTDGGANKNQQQRQIVHLYGENFGRASNDEFEITFMTTQEGSSPFVFDVPTSDILFRDHHNVSFYLPAGFGSAVRISVTVRGQSSSASSLFAYDAPTVSSIEPDCGTRFDDDGKLLKVQCYGYSYPGYRRVEHYPRIHSIQVREEEEVGNRKVGVVTLLPRTKSKEFTPPPFPIEIGDTLRITGMDSSRGVRTGTLTNFNGDVSVTGVSAIVPGGDFPAQFEFVIPDAMTTVTDSYLGWDHPRGNLRALVAKLHQKTSARTLETDGCSTEMRPGGTRVSFWEPFDIFQQRRLNADPNADDVVDRACSGSTGDEDRRQVIIIRGSGFGASGLHTPLQVTMRRKLCDCFFSLSGEDTPCMQPKTLLCAATTGGDGSEASQCPADYIDCRTATDDFDAPVMLEIQSHTHDTIVAVSPPGFGRHHQVHIVVGKSRSADNATLTATRANVVGYLPPSVSAFETEASRNGQGVAVFRPDGTTRITLLGHNFGYGGVGNMSRLIEVHIGTEYDVNGEFCGDDDRCMKPCKAPRWFPSKASGTESTLGFPYIDCVIPIDTAGFKNISLRVAGQVDDCRTNKLLCGFPVNFPADRRVTPVDDRINVTKIVGNAAVNGLIFTCSKSSESAQSTAAPGELCTNDANSACADQDCTQPKANAGFWRLDLDLEFACTAGAASHPTGVDALDKPCQVNFAELVAGQDATDGSGLDPLQAYGISNDALCLAGNQIGQNRTSCANDLRLCTQRGTMPGACLFRRPKEARRALGDKFWPWACPTVNAPTREGCQEANRDAYDYVNSIAQATCPVSRTQHLVDSSVYEEFPNLVQSPTCYGIVACNPKDSCLGNNQCGEGYEYNKHRCVAWNEANPDRMNCTSDDQCRSRSGTVTSSNGASSGLSSACAFDKPEDCSRCIFGDPSSSVGQCECMGGGPRCGLCRQRGGGINPETGEEWKGYYRLNDECQVCPDNPGLLLVLMALAIVTFCVVGWWMQDQKVNVAFLSIGVDYFQVLAIFARIKVRWPTWMKDVLQILSIFNLNVDIAAPECLVPEFDYSVKWTIMMTLPLIFAGVLLFVFLGILLFKVCKYTTGCASRKPRYCAHGGKLGAMFIVIFYFVYLSVTRRALDIFNCNPSDPPDGYLYTEFSSTMCAGGTCICDDPAGLQMALRPAAIVGFLLYSIGFPAFVGVVTWYYRQQMKCDQVLRAYALGSSRKESISNLWFHKGCMRSESKDVYGIRKTYSQLYYHFKPGKVYWMLAIVTRKLAVALVALFFRQNVAFCLSCVIIVLLTAFVLQVRNRPYMSTVEQQEVRRAHRAKARHAEALMNDGKQASNELMLHKEMYSQIHSLRSSIQRHESFNKSKRNLKSLDASSSSMKNKKTRKSLRERAEMGSNAYFDYNTVEQTLLMCAIFLSLVAIMFESGQFYDLDPETGIETLSTNPITVGFYTGVTAMGALTLVGSLVYYFIVFIAEIFSIAPKSMIALCTMLICCGRGRQSSATATRTRRDSTLSVDGEGSEIVEMTSNFMNLAASRVNAKELEEAKQKAREAEARSNKLLAERTKLRKNQRNGNAQGLKKKGSAGRLTRGKVQQKMKKKVKKTMAIAKTVMNEGGNAKVKLNELYLDKGV
jgi:hypothetical protein